MAVVSEPIQKIGSSIKRYGKIQILSVIASMIIGFIIGAEASSIIDSSNSLDSTTYSTLDNDMNSFAKELRTYMGVIIVVNLITVYFLFKIARSIHSFPSDHPTYQNNLIKSQLSFYLGIILSIIGSILSYDFMISFTNKLEKLSHQHPDKSEYRKTISGFASSSFAMNLVDLLTYGTVILAFYFLGNWLNVFNHNMSSNSSDPYISKAQGSINTIKIGYGMLIIGMLIPVSIGTWLIIIGLIVSIIGLVQTGGNLEQVTLADDFIAPNPTKSKFTSTTNA